MYDIKGVVKTNVIEVNAVVTSEEVSFSAIILLTTTVINCNVTTPDYYLIPEEIENRISALEEFEQEFDLAFPDATETIKGKVALYSSLGNNTDGTITQKAAKDNLELKVEKVSGYSLTKNDLTNALKGFYDGAVSWISENGTNLVNHLSNTSNPHGITKAQIGLGNVPNTDFTDEIESKVDKIEDHELVSVSHLLHQARMDIRNFNFHMETSLQNQ
jgi:hypothetical protein